MASVVAWKLARISLPLLNLACLIKFNVLISMCKDIANLGAAVTIQTQDSARQNTIRWKLTIPMKMLLSKFV